jgi:sulfur-oxidizing protein SoxX
MIAGVMLGTRAWADSAPAPLGGLTGDPVRGLAIVRDRATGNCLICHRAPIANEPFQGELGPDLAGVGNRLTAGQIRYRLIDQSRLNSDTLMPPYHRVDGLTRVGARFQGQPALSAQQVEDVVAWLVTLRD